MVRLDIHFRAELKWPGTIEMGLGVSKFGRTSVTFDQVVFSRRQLRGVVAIGLGADRRDFAQADAADRRGQEKFRALVAARFQAGMMRAALLAFLIVAAATHPAAADEFLSRGFAHSLCRRRSTRP